MMDDLAVLFDVFPYAIGAGLIMATVCSVLGVFVVLKRVVFIGIALTQSAAAGIALAFMLGAPPMTGALLMTMLTVTLLAYPYESRRVPRDAVLGAIYVFAAAISILIVSKSGFGLTEVQALLYGDLIVASQRDFWHLLFLLGGVFICFLLFFRPILFSFLDRDQARAVGLKAAIWELLFFLLLGLAASGASQAGGSLLVFCYLTVPAMMSLLIANRLWATMLISALTACLATLVGLYASYKTDLPTNQTIIAILCGMLAAVAAYRIILPRIRRLRHRATGHTNQLNTNTPHD